MKERTRKYVKLSLILYVALLSAAVIATVAWFVSERTVSIQTSDDMVIQAGQQLEISMGDDSANWGSTIGISLNNHQYLPDITGDGEKFYYPTTLDSNDHTLTDAETFLNVSENPDGKYYIELKVKFRTAAQTKVYLSNQSFIKPKDEELVNQNDRTESVSKDILAGAVRVCFFDEADPDNRIIWIPNDRYELSNTDEGKHAFTQNGEREAYHYMFVENGEVSPKYWTTDDYNAGTVIVGTTALASPSKTVDDVVSPAMTNGGAPLLSFEGSDQMVEKTLVIRVWVEGTDREAHTDLVGGQFSYNLDFIAINKEENNNTLGTVTWAEDNTLQGVDGKDVLYSFDAIDWKPYSNQIANSEGYDTVYVREKETAAKTCGVVTSITRPSATQ